MIQRFVKQNVFIVLLIWATIYFQASNTCELEEYHEDCSSNHLENCLKCQPEELLCYICKAGFNGDYCDHSCEENDESCENECPRQCLQCHPIEKNCCNCTPGFKGRYCEHFCDPGTWGAQCRETCPSECKTWCHPVNGMCYRPTCLGNSDYNGFFKCTCDLEADGEHCQSNCSTNCLICNFHDHTCYMCKDGYEGDHCEKVCKPENEVMAKCSYCNHFEEDCYKCKPGYAEYTCEQYCRPGTWGPYCFQNCPSNCSFSCHPVTGLCPKMCKPGTYGRDCKENCSLNCLDNCNHIDGHCSLCKPGYYGNRCDRTEELRAEDTSLSHNMAIGFGSVIFLLFVIVVIVFLNIRRSKLRRLEQSEPKFPLVRNGL